METRKRKGSALERREGTEGPKPTAQLTAGSPPSKDSAAPAHPSVEADARNAKRSGFKSLLVLANRTVRHAVHPAIQHAAICAASLPASSTSSASGRERASVHLFERYVRRLQISGQRTLAAHVQKLTSPRRPLQPLPRHPRGTSSLHTSFVFHRGTVSFARLSF